MHLVVMEQLAVLAELAFRSGGGGSGYSNGEVNVVDTQLGGSTFDKSKVIIRIAEPPRIGSVVHSI